jgi:hypothetical protein
LACIRIKSNFNRQARCHKSTGELHPELIYSQVEPQLPSIYYIQCYCRVRSIQSLTYRETRLLQSAYN